MTFNLFSAMAIQIQKMLYLLDLSPLPIVRQA